MAKGLVQVQGVPAFLSRLRAANANIGAGVHRGLIRGGRYLQRKSQEIVPVQLGDLKRSAFTRNIGGFGFNADIIVGYTAKYAVYVHEDLQKRHGRAFNLHYAKQIAAAKGKKAGTAAGGMFKRGDEEQAKFLEKPAREERKFILGIIAMEAKI
jgi:hypothetical protein